MFRLALRNVIRHRVRSGLALAAIVLGVVGVILVGGFVDDVFYQLREATIHSQLGHLQIYRAGYSEYGRQNPYEYLVEDPELPLAALRRQTGVSEVAMRLNFSGLASNGQGSAMILGEGVEPDKEARLGTFVTVIGGRQLADSDAYGTLLGEGVARSLKVAPGDTLTVLVTTPEGALNTLEFSVVGVFRSISQEYDNRAVRIPLAAAQELLATTGVHALVVALEATERTDEVAGSLRAELPGDRFEVKPWHELADFYQKTVDLYRRQFGVLQLIVLVMVFLGVSNSINMAVHERLGEFGTLMALGDRGRDVFRMVVVENALMGVFGATVGVALGVGLALAISSIGIEMPPPPNSSVGYVGTVRVGSDVVLTGAVIGLLSAIFASLLPARRVARTPVVEALRRNV